MATAELTWELGDWSLGKDNDGTLKAYVFYDPATEDEADIEAAAIAVMPSFHASYALSTIFLKQHSYGMYLATGRYSPFEAPQSGATSEFEFEVSAENQRMVRNLATVNQYAAPSRASPNVYGLIGVTPDGVEGVDVPQPVYSFSETHYFDDADITEAYKIRCGSICGSVSNAAFRGFAIGEVLCTGIAGSKRGREQWQIRFRFSVSPNAASFSVGPVTGVTKRGWDYLEVHYEEVEDATNKLLLRRPFSVTIHQVLRYDSYADLGIT